MFFGRRAKIRKAVTRALARVEHETDVADHAPIEALAPALQPAAFGSLALALYDDERYPAAKISLDRALALEPDAVELNELAAALASELGLVEESIAAQRRVVAARPTDPTAIAALAERLLADERIDEVIELLRPLRRLADPTLERVLAEALHVAGEHAESLEILDEVCAYYDAQLKQLTAGDWQALKARAEDAERLRNDVYAELHGREATIELAAAAGKLDANAGVNYHLLGARLAATGPRIAEVLELEAPGATERRGRALLDREPHSAAGLVLVGSAQLRRGEVGAARKSFERACQADGRCFAAFFGLGAAMDHEQHRLHRRAAAFAPAPAAGPALTAVVTDWPALTEAERRVVWASAQPLASALPILAERAVTMRILPIDVRATDIELLADAAGDRADDHRSYDAISGLATHGGAIAKIEGLLDVVTEGGWTFAHELAHLAFFHLPEEQAAPIVSLYEHAIDVGYANTDYALSNVDEFFAVAYTDHLRLHHDLPGAPLVDDAGIQRELASYFDRFARRARALVDA